MLSLNINKTAKLLLGFMLVIFILPSVSGCAINNNDNISEQSVGYLRANAFIDPDLIIIDDETDPATEIITGTVSFSSKEKVNTKSTEISTENTDITIGADININEASEIVETSELYVITPSGKKYHYPTCHNARNVYKLLTKEEAVKLGYEPCKTCKPE